MSHRTGCRHRVPLPTRLSPHPASFSQTNPSHLGGQNPGQLFTQPPYGVCFSIDPQMMCYYSGGAENYMTKTGLFLREQPKAEILQYSFMPHSEGEREPFPELGGHSLGTRGGKNNSALTTSGWASGLFSVCVLLNSRFPLDCSPCDLFLL